MDSLQNTLMAISIYEDMNKQQDVSTWTNQQCYNWAIEVSQKLGASQQQANIYNFNNFTGAQLKNFTAQDFTERICHNYGSFFYERFQDLLSSQNFGAMGQVDTENYLTETSWCIDEVFPALTPPTRATTPDDHWEPLCLDREDFVDLDAPLPNLVIDDFPGDTDGLGLPSNFPSLTPSSSPSHNSLTSLDFGTFYIPPGSSPNNSPSSSPTNYVIAEDQLEGATAHLPNYPSTVEEPWPECSYTPHPSYNQVPRDTQTQTRRRRHTRTPPTYQEQQQQGPLESLQTLSRKRSRGPKSWEFLMRLLASPEYNPSLISWVEESKGTFKLNNAGQIARMWGHRSRKRGEQDLSYDNFARGLRYHYKTGALQPVSERQLVYKCGEKALCFLRSLQS